MTTPCDKYLEAVEGRLAAATQGPWNRVGDGINAGKNIVVSETIIYETTGFSREDDAELSAHGRTDLETLANMVKVARETFGLLKDTRPTEQVKLFSETALKELDRLASEGMG